MHLIPWPGEPSSSRQPGRLDHKADGQDGRQLLQEDLGVQFGGHRHRRGCGEFPPSAVVATLKATLEATLVMVSVVWALPKVKANAIWQRGPTDGRCSRDLT
jgi:hypothetical protein